MDLDIAFSGGVMLIDRLKLVVSFGNLAVGGRLRYVRKMR